MQLTVKQQTCLTRKSRRRSRSNSTNSSEMSVSEDNAIFNIANEIALAGYLIYSQEKAVYTAILSLSSRSDLINALSILYFPEPPQPKISIHLITVFPPLATCLYL